MLWTQSKQIIIPRQKPRGPVEISRGHMLATGLSALWLFNQPGGYFVRDLMGAHHGVVSGTVTGWAFGPGGLGPAMNCSGSGFADGCYMTMSDPSSFTGDEITIAVWVRLLDQSYYNVLADNRFFEAADVGVTLRDNWNDTWRFETGTGSGVNVAASDAKPTIGVDYFVLGSSKVGTDTHFLQVNGVTQSSKASPSAVDIAGPAQMVIGGGDWSAFPNFFPSHTIGPIYFAAIWERALSEAEGTNFYRNIYQILRRPAARSHFFVPEPSGGGGTTIPVLRHHYVQQGAA